MKKRLKINGIIMFAAFLSVALFPAIFMRRGSAGPLEEIGEIIGISFILLGQFIRVSARGYKAEHSGEGTILITAGLYSLTRNPMYLGIVLIGLGVILILFKWWVAAVFLSLFIFRYLPLIVKEEKKLRQIFLEDYAAYCRKAPRLIPKLSVLITQDISEYLPLKLSWFKKEIGAIWALLFGVLLIETWEDILTEGIKVYLGEARYMFFVMIFFIFLAAYLSRRTGNGDQQG